MRRLVVCCDGTWNTPDQEHAGVPTPTNVVRIYNALAETGEDGVEQPSYYHPGVGTEGSPWERLRGGSVGAGLGKNVMSAYKWLADHYQAEDQIFLFGFSRGAYTVRSVVGMISACGLLDLAGLDEKESWRRVERAYEKCYRVHPDKRKPGWSKDWTFHTGDADDGGVRIFFLGVWDTVGALGIPDDLALLNLFDPDRKHDFHDTKLTERVVHACHAVALDEWRASFSPTLWTNVEDRENVHQVWFPGAHSDVGGGYPERGLSDGALRWMIDHASSDAVGLAFRPDMVDQIEPDFRDVLHDSHKGFFELLPTHPRSIPLLQAAEKPPEVHQSAWDRVAHPPIAQAVYHPTRILGPGDEVPRAIYARQPWNETGIYLQAGVDYELRATGEWLDRTIPAPPSGATDGKFHPAEVIHLAGTLWGGVETAFRWVTGSKSADFKGTKRIEEYKWFALVGAIANAGNPAEDGTPTPPETFLIGDGCTVTPERPGYLYCYTNDAWNFYDNNRGSVTLTVKRG